MAAKRIYQIAKEFDCEEKKIIDFLTGQGIKVSNRLSAVSEEIYNLLKTKLFAPPPPPPPPPPPEPKPESVVEKPAQEVAPVETPTEAAPTQEGAKKKKKKKKKNPQPEGETPAEGDEAKEEQDPDFQVPISLDAINAASKVVSAAGIIAGNDFIRNYNPDSKRKKRNLAAVLTRGMDVWGLMEDLKFDNPDAAPIRYWYAVSKLVTKAYKLLQDFGLKNRESLGEMRNAMKNVGTKYEPQEIFTDEENQMFEAQQKFFFEAFGHGMGKVNDNLFDLKMYAEEKKRACEHISFVDYITNPENKLETKVPMPFDLLAETILFSIRSVPYHVGFYQENKERILLAIENFYAWIDGYKTLKEQGADPAKLEKYLYLEKKFFKLVEFMSFDNLVYIKRKSKPVPFVAMIDLLNGYRDNMDDPDAERNFKYKTRGVATTLYKPKEYIFLYQLAELEPNKDYRPPEEIAAAEAKAKAEAEAAAKAEAKATAEAEAPAETPTESDSV